MSDEVKVAELEAHVARLREALEHYDGRAYHSDRESDGHIQWVAEHALKETPEQSLAEVRRAAFEEAAKVCEARKSECADRPEDYPCERCCENDEVAAAIRALAAQEGEKDA